MYINTWNIWTTYDKFNSVSNINNKDIKWVCRVIYPPPPHTHTHKHTELSDKDNEEIEARGLKIVFEHVFYEDSFKRGSKISQFKSVSLLGYLTKLLINGNKNQGDIYWFIHSYLSVLFSSQNTEAHIWMKLKISWTKCKTTTLHQSLCEHCILWTAIIFFKALCMHAACVCACGYVLF